MGVRASVPVRLSTTLPVYLPSSPPTLYIRTFLRFLMFMHLTPPTQHCNLVSTPAPFFLSSTSGFDSESAEKIGDYMARHGTKFIRPAVPSKVEKLDNGKLRVSFTHTGVEKTEDFDTVLWAIGREPLTKDIGLQSVGVKLDEK